MDLRSTLEALGVDSLGDLTLEELMDKVGPNEDKVLHIFMGWLSELIRKGSRRDLSSFVRTLAKEFSVGEIMAVFEEWQAKDVEEHPSVKFEYIRVRDDIFRGLRTSNFNQPYTGSPYTEHSEKENYMDRSYNDHSHENYTDRSYTDHSIKKENKTKAHSRKRRLFSKKLWCKRCKKTGHAVVECPTYLDPALDRTPGANYRCVICKAMGEHFMNVCPRNEDPGSWTQMRLQMKGDVMLDPDSYSDRRSNYSSRRSVSSDRRSSYADRRSSSPRRRRSRAEQSRHRVRDNYRPDNYSVSSVSAHRPPRKRRGKGRSKTLRQYQSSPPRRLQERPDIGAQGGLNYDDNYDDDLYVKPSQKTHNPFISPPLASDPAMAVDEEEASGDMMDICETPLSQGTPEIVPDGTERAKRDADDFLDRLAKDFPANKYSAEAVALLDRCSIILIGRKAKRTKAADLMD
ncbi:hypothetical protein GGR53DRAFT_442022 [Hypoxylon sp. FL1150]|nr:hypothetical protein GGR53DRAFT_442022 [Hypoxylon sp. FL1150]